MPGEARVIVPTPAYACKTNCILQAAHPSFRLPRLREVGSHGGAERPTGVKKAPGDHKQQLTSAFKLSIVFFLERS